jgi:hypothetical protein
LQRRIRRGSFERRVPGGKGKPSGYLECSEESHSLTIGESMGGTTYMANQCPTAPNRPPNVPSPLVGLYGSGRDECALKSQPFLELVGVDHIST